jgi:protein-tyrosine phosphatase
MSWKATAAPSQITDLIFLGSKRHAMNLAQENLSGIKAVLDVASRRPYAQADSIEYKRVPLQDTEPISSDNFEACIEFIQAHVNGGNKILVHCYAGRNRSTAIVIGFLLASKQYQTWKDAFQYIKSKRECVGCNSKVKESVLAALGGKKVMPMKKLKVDKDKLYLSLLSKTTTPPPAKLTHGYLSPADATALFNSLVGIQWDKLYNQYGLLIKRRTKTFYEGDFQAATNYMNAYDDQGSIPSRSLKLHKKCKI